MIHCNFNKLSLILNLFLFAPIANSQIIINEFSASNANQIEDLTYNDYSDWIELFNTGTSAQNLNGYYISDNYNIPDKWQISEDLTIDVGGYAIIWADGNASGIHTNFKLSAAGEEIILCSPYREVLDSISYGAQKTDVSMGREPDGISNWVFFPESTPNESNTTASYLGFVGNVPEFGLRGGFYSSSQSLTLFTDLGGDIYYTTDGSQPIASSNKYSLPITISSTTILRARVLKPNLIPGPTVTQSYFINENSADAILPVISIASEASNFWDQETGIYVQSYKPLWEIPINIELFENNGSDRAAFNERAGCKVNGLYSWQLPQKMLGVYFRKQYGNNNLDYPVTQQRQRSSYKSFSLRASGNDWSYTLFRDILGHHSSLMNMDLNIMGYKPSVVYINGQYMGIHNIREKVDDDYIEKSFNIESGTFDLIENQDYAEAGDLDAYNELLSLLDKDLSIDANFELVASQIDIENFTDYIITEMAVANTSINHNVMAWKPKNSGKWEWILMDVDRGFFNAGQHLISYFEDQSAWPFGKLLNNEGYREYFGKRLADQLFTSYNPERLKTLINEHKQSIESEMANHINRWQGTTSSYGDAIPSLEDWRSNVNDLQTFVEQRPTVLLNDLENYGFDGTSNLLLSVSPINAGTIRLNGLSIPEGNCYGLYLNNVSAQLIAENNPAYKFLHWAEAQENTLIKKGASWSYLDTGTDLGTDWISSTFNDAAWNTGMAQLGYGDGDETTTIDYGSNNNNKHITTYFRLNFSINEAQKSAGQLILNLLCDDGAVVYLNENEIIRQNIDEGDVTYQTLASMSISGSSEDIFTPYTINADHLIIGDNTLAVEIHQHEKNSSDLSFDLEMISYTAKANSNISNNKILNLNIESNNYLFAIFEQINQCIVPSVISSNTSLSKNCSPYLVQGDVTIENNATLTIEPGVEIWMSKDANIWINGSLNALGTVNERIVFKLNPNVDAISWGALLFKDTPLSSNLQYVTIEDASEGPDPVYDIAAISAFNADLFLDNLSIVKVNSNPITARYSDITLTNSSLHSEVTGDCINVKYGNAYIENCIFKGNSQADADAIDYDEIENGVIKNCIISDFKGFNSDAIDIGEKATNIKIDSITVYNISDKGVSLGQRSSAIIQDAIFINCNKGVALKDSSNALINRCVFYNTVDAIACYEKNLGSAGGNAKVRNSIISNTSNQSFYVDSKSTLQSQYCLTDSDTINTYAANIQGNPLFSNPTLFNFHLNAGSPALDAGLENGSVIDLGTSPFYFDFQPSVMISQIYVNGDNYIYPEFITLYNPSNISLDLSGYTISKGVTAIIPEGVIIGSKDVIYISNNSTANNWWGIDKPLVEWQEGKLSNNGEAIQLEDNYGIVIDFVNYQNDSLWPTAAFHSESILNLISENLDNHFPDSWEAIDITQVLGLDQNTIERKVSIFPNPTKGQLTIQTNNNYNEELKIFNFSGQLILESQLDDSSTKTLNISEFPSGIYFIKVADKIEKLIKL